jgi:dihydrofolate synthase/folylpolyglutamate synthase
MGWAEWPARLQRLEPGPLSNLLPEGASLWVDGGHNPAAARALAESLAGITAGGQPVALVAGLLAAKDAQGFLKALAGRVASVHTVPVPGHAHHDPAALATEAASCGLVARPMTGLVAALSAVAAAADPAQPPLVLIAGSLHLAGHALALNEQSAG